MDTETAFGNWHEGDAYERYIGRLPSGSTVAACQGLGGSWQRDLMAGSRHTGKGGSTMRAIIVSTPGEAGVLALADVEIPTIGHGEVRIEVTAAGVNGADVSQRQGHYPPPAGAPEWPGLEVSGVVSEVGSDVDGFAVGDRVCALLQGGGYAEQVVVDAGLVLPVPAGIDLVHAAGLAEVAATVWSNVFMMAGLQPGETLLVHGGTSGIGTMAIQVATALGSPVITTAGSAKKVAFVESLGATGVNYRTTDFVEVVREITGGKGADVILDMVGGDYLARNISALAVGGRIACIANRSGDQSTFSIGALMRKRGSIFAATLRARPLHERTQVIAGVLENVWPLLSTGAVKPVIDSVFDLGDAVKAHQRMESSAHIGKILLRV